MEPAAGVEPKRGGLVLRILGVLLLLLGLYNLLSLAGPLLGELGTTLLLSNAAENAWFLGVWQITGPWAFVNAFITAALFVFSGVQLLRLKRSGWIAATVVLAYVAVSFFLFITTSQMEKTFIATRSLEGLKPDEKQLLLEQFVGQLEPARRGVWFYFTVHAMLAVYVLSEWRPFFGARRRTPPLRQKALVAVVLLVIGASAAWTFWGADYLAYRRVLNSSIHAPEPALTENAMQRLSPARRFEVAAILIRRLEQERSGGVARSIISSGAAVDLARLTPEDVPRIIEAAREAPTTPAEETEAAMEGVAVRKACYEILGNIGTKDAQQGLVDALNGPRDAAWDEALSALVPMKLARAPDVLLKLAKEGDNDVRSVIAALGSTRDDRVPPLLDELVRSADTEKQWGALIALGRRPGPPSERGLQRCLDDNALWVRGEACWSLTRIGTASSIPPLVEMLKRPQDHYQLPGIGNVLSLHADAARALSTITGRDFGQDAGAWERWWTEAGPAFDLRKELASRMFTPVPAAPASLPGSRKEMQESPFMKASAAQAMALQVIQYRGMRELAPELAKYLRLPATKAPWQFLAATILAEWGCREGIEWWIDKVDSPEPGLCRPAIRTLGPATGVNFFADKARWLDWWKANKDRFPSAEKP
jgi:HEAT repeat protein